MVEEVSIRWRLRQRNIVPRCRGYNALWGVGESGMGAYHGKAEFDMFSHLKSVFYQPKVNVSFVFNLPRASISAHGG